MTPGRVGGRSRDPGPPQARRRRPAGLGARTPRAGLAQGCAPHGTRQKPPDPKGRDAPSDRETSIFFKGATRRARAECSQGRRRLGGGGRQLPPAGAESIPKRGLRTGGRKSPQGRGTPAGAGSAGRRGGGGGQARTCWGRVPRRGHVLARGIRAESKCQETRKQDAGAASGATTRPVRKSAESGSHWLVTCHQESR